MATELRGIVMHDFWENATHAVVWTEMRAAPWDPPGETRRCYASPCYSRSGATLQLLRVLADRRCFVESILISDEPHAALASTY